ncbi:tetratricopeptide repeat-containing sensor histidine kinase [Mucilaginibacter celer]|uniref:tetratricopeptide repeat-containing sensor histidine kinase n=1 Tax=Mucilaginibacter celer TaxID=2305508 RepID=UPI0013CE9E6A|nr:sensor histidine kinase [Mucilaginibacter celer]
MKNGTILVRACNCKNATELFLTLPLIMKPRVLYIFFSFLFIFSFPDFARSQSFPALNNAGRDAGTQKQDTNRVLALLKHSRTLIMKTAVTRPEADSAGMLCSRARQLAFKLHYLRGTGNELLIRALILRWQKDGEGSRKTALQALEIFKKINDPAGQADAYNICGDGLSNADNQIVQKIGYFKQAIRMLLISDQKERAAALLTYLGDLEICNSSYNQALKDLQHSLSLYRSVNSKNLQATYDLIGYDYIQLHNINEALKYNLLAVQTAEQNGESGSLLATIYNRIALTYAFAEDWPKCTSYLKKALHQAYKMNDSLSIVQISFNVAAAMSHSHQVAASIPVITRIQSFKLFQQDITWRARAATLLLEAYIQKKDYKVARHYFNECVNFLNSKKIEQHVYEGIFSGIIAYYQATNQFDKTYPYITAHVRYCNAAKIALSVDNDDDFRLFKADSASGKMLSAVRHLQRYMLFSDSVKSEKNRKQTALLEVQFEAEKKDRDIRFKEKNIKLLTRQAQLQDIGFRQERMIRNWTIAASVLLLLVIAILYNRFRLKQRSSRFLETQHLALKAQQQEINCKNKELVHLNEKQFDLLKEKEWLLREIHHRVKNNLQITMSLLNIQSSYMDNGFALDAIVNSQRRMQAMSLIHTKLYQSDNLAYIDMSSYIPELVGYIKDSFNEGEFIRFELQTPPFQLDISQAVPIGLILNEAITNCIKYAFRGRSAGRIRIIMEKDDHDLYTLTIADDGVGIPEEKDGAIRNSLGMNLMRGLTVQLQGEFSVKNTNGTTITVQFKDFKLMAEELNTDQTK